MALAAAPSEFIDMNRLFLLIALFSTFAHAEAPSAELDFKEISFCSTKLDPYLTPPKLTTKRIGKLVVATASASANCSAKVEGSAKYLGTSVSLALSSSYKANEPVAGCNCVRSFEYVLKRPVKKGTVLYLVFDGDAIAHSVVP